MMEDYPIGTKVQIIVPESKMSTAFKLIHMAVGVIVDKSNYKREFPTLTSHKLVRFDYAPNDLNGRAKKIEMSPIKTEWLIKICQCDFIFGNWSCTCGLGKKENERNFR